MYAQTIPNISINNKEKTITRIIRGQILDSITKLPVRNPYIEVYKGDTLLHFVRGGIDGKYEFIIKNSPANTDTVSLRITSGCHSGKVIENLPLKKIKTVINASIPKDGPAPYFNNKNIDRWDKGEGVWTGERSN